MDSSFLTFSPKNLAKKISSNSLRGQSKKILFSKKLLPREVCCLPSNQENVRHGRKDTPTKSISDTIVLDDSVVFIMEEKKNVESSILSSCVSSDLIESYSCGENHEKLSISRVQEKDLESSRCNKFDDIKNWLNELHEANEKETVISISSTSDSSGLCTKFTSDSNNSVQRDRRDNYLYLTVPESSDENSSSQKEKSFQVNRSGTDSRKSKERNLDWRKVASRCSNNSSSSDDGSNKSSNSCVSSESFHLQKRKKNVICIDDESDSNSDSVSCISESSLCMKASSETSNKPTERKECDNLRLHSSDRIGSETSIDKLLSTLYDTEWNRKTVFTPKVHKHESLLKNPMPNEDNACVSNLLSEYYGNAWNEKEVLTPVNRRVTSKINGKENTPPLPGKKKLVGRTKTGISKILPENLSTPKSCIGIREQLKSARSDDLLSFLRSLSASPSPTLCDPKALIFKNEFKKNKEKLCAQLFKLFNEAVFDNKLPSTIKIEWSQRMTRTAGFCRQFWISGPEGKIRSASVKLSVKVCSTADRVRDTLIHELCHAATWIIDGLREPHGRCWKAWARKAMKSFPELPPITRCHNYKISTKYVYKCKSCGYSFGRHSKSLDLNRKRCGKCYGEFELFISTKTNKSDEGLLPSLRTPRAAKGFALFVKDNYKSTKEKNSDLKHAEIMKLLGNQFSDMKVASKE